MFVGLNISNVSSFINPVVLTPEPTAVMDAYSLIKILSNQHFKENLSLLLNQVESKNEAIDISNRMSGVIKEYLGIEIKVIGFIPDDLRVKKSVKEQKALLTRFPFSDAGKAIKETADVLVEKKGTLNSRGMKGFVYRIIGMFNGK